METLPIETLIYYKGDMANPEGFGIITENSEKYYKVDMEGGGKKVLPKELYGDRFITYEEYRTKRNEMLEKLYGKF
ncbi:MAG TPA: hypothetical protein PLQ36_01435 [Candidatus Gracilibacteria bacterium]|nr:hypothetical protein [Candidatus Gracilibacteria bacterium]